MAHPGKVAVQASQRAAGGRYGKGVKPKGYPDDDVSRKLRCQKMLKKNRPAVANVTNEMVEYAAKEEK